MTFKTTLTKDKLFRLTILRHMQRPTFFFNAITSSLVIAYGVWSELLVLVFIGWLPFVLYIGLGVIDGLHNSSDKNNQLTLPTTYELQTTGLHVANRLDTGIIPWSSIRELRIMLDCYVFVLTNGQMVAIPQDAVPGHRLKEFEHLVRTYMEKRQRTQ